MNEMHVHFRFAGIQHSAGEIGVVILDYSTHLEAIKTFSRLHGYLTSAGDSKSMDVSFVERGDSTGDMSITPEYADQSMETRIVGIDWNFVERLCSSLQVFPYYLILAGYTEKGEFHLLPAKDYHFFKADIRVNGRWIKGVLNESVDWNALIENL